MAKTDVNTCNEQSTNDFIVYHDEPDTATPPSSREPDSPLADMNPAQLVLLHIDDHAWASVEHYMQASKFSHRQDIYMKFPLDSGDPLGRSPAANARRVGRKTAPGQDHGKAWQTRK